MEWIKEHMVAERMMNKILACLVFVALVAVSVSALSPPMPVSLSVQNLGTLDGYHVQFYNENTGENHEVLTDQNGFAMFDYSGATAGWSAGNVIKITISECSSNTACVVHKTLDSKATPIYFSVDLTGIACPNCASCQVCPDHDCDCDKCEECEVCETCQSCPPVETCPDCVCPPEKECPSCPDCVCPEPEECVVPDTGVWGWLIGVIAFILGISSDKVAVYYKNKKTGKFKKVTQARINDGTVKKEAG